MRDSGVRNTGGAAAAQPGAGPEEHGPADSPARGPARPGRGTEAALGESADG